MKNKFLTGLVTTSTLVSLLAGPMTTFAAENEDTVVTTANTEVNSEENTNVEKPSEDVNQRDPEQQLVTITIRYVNASGEEVLPSKEVKGESGSPYNITRDDLEGFTYVTVDGDESGVFSNDSVVTYTLAPVNNESANEGTVNVTYVAEDGTVLGESSKTGPIGENFNIPVRAFAGYKLKDGQTAVDGVYSSETQSVTFTYVKIDEATQENNGVDSEKTESESTQPETSENNNTSDTGTITNPTDNNESSEVESNSSVEETQSNSLESVDLSNSSNNNGSSSGTVVSSSTPRSTTSSSSRTSLNAPKTGVDGGSVLGLSAALFGTTGLGAYLTSMFKRKKD